MRTIKFRGRDVITGNWAYGFYYKSKGNHIIRDENDNECIVLEKSVGQFTGLLDKNGNEIYEGDILKCGSNPPLLNEVKIELTAYGMFVNYGYPYMHNFPCKDWCEVIGNIYSNPDLLK